MVYSDVKRHGRTQKSPGKRGNSPGQIVKAALQLAYHELTRHQIVRAKNPGTAIRTIEISIKAIRVSLDILTIKPGEVYPACMEFTIIGRDGKRKKRKEND